MTEWGRFHAKAAKGAKVLAGHTTPGVFAISKISQFPSKSTYFDLPAVLNTPIISNIHGAILIYRGFFWVDPLPTPEK
jgi:hypothetical protein